MIDKPNKDNVYVVPRAFEYTYYISDCIQDSHEYNELMQLFDSATENDLIRLVINNAGGEAGTCVQICDHIRTTQATVVGVLSGNAFSAAGVIWMVCDVHEVADHSMLMIHHAVGYAEGKFSDMTKYITATNKRVRLLYEDVFEGFLDDAELDSVMAGEEMWFTHEEVVERLRKREEYFLLTQQAQKEVVEQSLATLQAETENLNYEDLIKLPTKKAILEALGITPEDK